jgi:hypothetical protein
VKNLGVWGFAFAVRRNELEKTVDFYIFCDLPRDLLQSLPKVLNLI